MRASQAALPFMVSLPVVLSRAVTRSDICVLKDPSCFRVENGLEGKEEEARMTGYHSKSPCERWMMAWTRDIATRWTKVYRLGYILGIELPEFIGELG